MRKAPVGAPPPFIFSGQKVSCSAVAKLGRERRVARTLLFYPHPRAARGRGTVSRSEMVEGVQRRRLVFVAGVSSPPRNPLHHRRLLSLARWSPSPAFAGEERK